MNFKEFLTFHLPKKEKNIVIHEHLGPFPKTIQALKENDL